jgi:hypothetical protein
VTDVILVISYGNHTHLFAHTPAFQLQLLSRAVPQIRRLVASFPWRPPGFIANQVMWDLWWTGNRAIFLPVFQCPMSIVTSPFAPHSSSGIGIIGQIVIDVPSGPSLTHPKILKEDFNSSHLTFCMSVISHRGSDFKRQCSRSYSTLAFTHASSTKLNILIQRSGFDSRRYRIFWVMGLARGPLSLVTTI